MGEYENRNRASRPVGRSGADSNRRYQRDEMDFSEYREADRRRPQHRTEAARKTSQQGRRPAPSKGSRGTSYGERRPQDDYRRPAGNGRRPQNSSSRQNMSRRPENHRRKNKKSSIAIIIVELIVIALLASFACFFVFKLNVSKVTEVKVNEDDINKKIAQKVNENVAMKDYWNIALFGVDSRDGVLSSGTRTDCIIIASVNQKTGAIKLCSVYRDTYLNQSFSSKQQYGKCNAAYSYGGPEQAINMLNTNLDMDIRDFVTIGFGGLTDIIDELGGVEISVEDDEIVHLNNYQSTMAKELNKKYKAVTAPGVQTLTGLQATAYCRIRYTAGNDFARAQRQREVIQAIMTKARTANVNTLTNIANRVFDEMATSLKLSDVVDLLGNITKYQIVADDGFPQENQRWTGKVGGASSIVPVSLESNVSWLHQFLFDESGYAVSDTVKNYSGTISSKTAGLY